MRADDDGRVPIPAQGNVVCTGLWLNADLLARAPVETRQVPILVLRVDCIRVLRIDYRTKSIAALSNEPVFIADAADFQGPGGSAYTLVVLRTAVNVVEGLRVIDGDIVKLGYRQIVLVAPVHTAIETFIHAAIAAHEVIVRIRRINPDHVIVHMLVSLAEVTECLATVVGNTNQHVH